MWKRKFKVPQQTTYDDVTGLTITFRVVRGTPKLYLSGECLPYGNRDMDFHPKREGITGAGTGLAPDFCRPLHLTRKPTHDN